MVLFMPNKGSDENLQNLINTASQRLGTSPESLKKASEQGNVQDLLSGLSGDQAKKVQQILNDKEASQKLLNTPQAQALLKKLMGNK